MISPVFFLTLPLYLSFIMMNSKPVLKDRLMLIGITARTNNAKEMSGHGVIANQWQRVMSEKLIEKIPNRADSNIIAMYTDYDSDANGEYTFFIGAKVTSVDSIPNGMIAKQVPEARYAVFTSEKGPVWKVVPETWQKIWSTLASEMGERAFLADLEIYDERAADPQNAMVEVWVGIK
jgi:predicted transcriptional regulator YdeE